MEKRKISKQTKNKVLRLSAEILRMHGSIAGDRICQDWRGNGSPEKIFSDIERDDLEYNHQIKNSCLRDYEKGINNFGDEMVISFVMADAIDGIADDSNNEGKENLTQEEIFSLTMALMFLKGAGQNYIADKVDAIIISQLAKIESSNEK